MKEIGIKASDGLELSCIVSIVDNSKACIQIVHGMVEHKERYIPFIGELNQAGYSVIISDNRGHGKSVNEEYVLGHIGTPEQMVEDQFAVTAYIRQQMKQPIYMFAHSMGSLIARNYLMKHDNEIEKLILCGTVQYNTGVGLGIALSKLICKISGKTKYSKLLYAFSNNMSFKDDVSWISYSQENIKEYQSDPLCSFKFDAYGNLNLFKMDKNLKKYKKYEIKNQKLKILSISGKDDRTTGGTKGVRRSMEHLKRIGYRNVSFIEYEKMKHEILNEENNDIVIKDVLSFYE